MVVCRLSYRGKSRKGGPQTPLRCAQNAAFCKAFASAAGSRPYRRKAGAPVGGASDSAGANALSVKDGVSVYGQARLQKCGKNGFRKRTSRARRGRNASVKGLRRTERRLFCGRRRARPRSLPYPFYAKSFRGPSYPSRAILCAIKKDAGRTARRRPRRTEKRRQKRAGPKRLPVGDRFGGTHTPDGGNRRVGRVFPRAAPARASDRKSGRFPPPCGLSKKAHSPNPCADTVLPAFCERRSAKETKPAPTASEAGSASPQTRMRAKVRAGGPPDGPRTSAVTSGLRADRLFYSNCKGRFSSLFFSILIMIVPNPPRTARRKRQEGRFFLEDHY